MIEGQYYFRYIKSASQKRLRKWAKTTITETNKTWKARPICSRLSVLRTTNTIDVKLLNDVVQVTPQHMSWQLLTPNINQHLILVISHPYLVERQRELLGFGLKSQFDTPLLHITVCKYYCSDMLPLLPDFDIQIDMEHVFENQNQRHS